MKCEMRNENEVIYLLFQRRIAPCFLADRESVVTFIQELFDEEWGEGIDVMLADTHFETVLMEKHDGVLITRKEVFPFVYNA